MFGISGELIFLAIGGGFTLLIFFLGMAHLSRFYKSFTEARSEVDTNMMALVAQLKRLNTQLTDLTVEQRRLSRLMLEQIELKKAELTGDFEIVEEPLPEKTNPPKN